MATITAHPDTKSSKKVRLIARIRAFNHKQHNSDTLISVRDNDSSNRVVISFGSQSNRDVYEVECCYEQGQDNLAIYSREIKPLLPSVYDGQNLTIIGFGARGSGKTYAIRGNEKERGLAALAMTNIFSDLGDNENGMSISISLFEIHHKHVYDLLDPKRPEVQVLEGAQGKIKLKGLSEAVIKSVSEFDKLYSLGYSTNRRSHRGLIVQISSKNGDRKNSKIVGKLTFVDLAGFEDARRKSCNGVDLIENSRINKTLYSLLNVVHAINANEPRVPFRESKLTHMLQESFGINNRVLLLTCLNPFLCQDTAFALRLASRSCQGVNRMSLNSMQKSKYLGKPNVSSAVEGKLNDGSCVKKPASATPYISIRRKSHKTKERKVDDKERETSGLEQSKGPSASEMQSRFLSEINLEIKPVSQQKEALIPTVLDVEETKNEETSELNSLEDYEKFIEQTRIESHNLETTPCVDGNSKAPTLFEGDNQEKENNNILVKNDGSPPLSSRLRELSNNLRSLYTSTPIQIILPPEADSSTSCGGDLSFTKALEPNTPMHDKLDLARFNSPWKEFSTRSSGLKHSLANEYLKFINSASKEELKSLPGIGEKRASYILDLREESLEPFKNLEDLKDIGLSAKQINGMMKKVAGDLFSQ